MKMFAGGVLGLDVLQIFGEKFSRNSCKSIKVSPEQSVEDTPARSFFGNYEDENKEENSQPTTSQSALQLKIPHRVPISERQLPEWAIDSVTCSQMVHPIMLPSGYWVDRSTLEKWKKESLLWSRPPTDPFTVGLCKKKVTSVVPFDIYIIGKLCFLRIEWYCSLFLGR